LVYLSIVYLQGNNAYIRREFKNITVLEKNIKFMYIWGYTVVQLPEALCYKSKGRGFDS